MIETVEKAFRNIIFGNNKIIVSFIDDICQMMTDIYSLKYCHNMIVRTYNEIKFELNPTKHEVVIFNTMNDDNKKDLIFMNTNQCSW